MKMTVPSIDLKKTGRVEKLERVPLRINHPSPAILHACLHQVNHKTCDPTGNAVPSNVAIMANVNELNVNSRAAGNGVLVLYVQSRNHAFPLSARKSSHDCSLIVTAYIFSRDLLVPPLLFVMVFHCLRKNSFFFLFFSFLSLRFNYRDERWRLGL